MRRIKKKIYRVSPVLPALNFLSIFLITGVKSRTKRMARDKITKTDAARAVPLIKLSALTVFRIVAARITESKDASCRREKAIR